METFEEVQTWLQNTYNIRVSSEWLTACLEWIQQENQDLPLPINDLLSQVFEQWLQSDLSEIGKPLLPQHLAAADKFELFGIYPLQLLSLVDIGFPLYGQKQKLNGHTNPNEEVSADKPFQPAWEPKPSRMLLLQLTDGHTQIQAIEHRQITDLHQMLPSGLKIIVSGTVLCRRGLIMLTPECFQILGGEAEALIQQNNLLANLENAMLKNREDEGKHTRKEFSGRFITRGDNKLDDKQKPSLHKFKYEIPNNYQRVTQFDSQKVKQESVTAFNRQGNLKQELMSQNVHKKPFKQESYQSENEVNYDDCFDDDLNLEEIDAMDNITTDIIDSTAVKMGFNSVSHESDSNIFEPNRCKKYSHHSNLFGVDNVEDKNSHQVTNQSRMTNQTTNSFNDKKKQQLFLQQNDLEFIDDDFYVDHVPDFSVPSVAENGHRLELETTSNKMELGSNCKTDKNSFYNESHSEFLLELVNNASNPRTGAMSSSSFKQHMFKETKAQANTSTSSGGSKETQSLPTKRNKHLKVKSGSQEKLPNESQISKQCKLSYMFATKPCESNAKQTSFDDFDDDCSIIDSDQLPWSKTSDNFHKISDLLPDSNLTPLNDDCLVTDQEILTYSLPLFIQQNTQFNSPSLSSRLDTTLDKVIPPSKGSSSNVSIKTINISRISDSKMEYETTERDIQKLPLQVVQPLSSSIQCSDSLSSDNKSPFQYLSDFAKMQHPVTVTVKAYISTLIDKLGANGGANWSLGCRINDGTACMDVDLADSVLTELIGFSAQDSVVMRQKIKMEPRVKTILMEGLSMCQQKLINISCLMEVSAVSVTRKPVIRKLIPLTRQHVCELMKRVEKCLYT